MPHPRTRSFSLKQPLLSFPAHTHSTSRPPSPLLLALHEALTENILPSPPPPAKLPSSHSLLRPPPLISSIRHTSPSAIPPATSDSHVALIPSLSLIPASSSARSSLDTLRSIHTSAIPQTSTPPSFREWWFPSDSDASKESITGVSNESPSSGKKFRAPNAPLVFCHGLLGFDSLTIGPAIAPLQVSHWRGIKEALEANGCEVLITRVPATSSPVDRAKVLEKKISETYPGREVHLIGHSMGGIDCRYLITHLTQRAFRVLSLTTIATPHRGSPFASHFLSLASPHLPAVLALLELLPNGIGDGKAVESLTREAMKEFNDDTPDVEGVRYFSWGAEYEPGLIDTWKYPHSIVAAQEGPNDGMVSIQSAQWGTYLGTLRNVTHLDLVGWTGGFAGNLSSIAGFKDMHAYILGKDVGFSAERFYGGVADLLAGVEEEEGYVVDGKWVGWEGKEDKKIATESKTKEAAAGRKDVMERSASDQERRRMEEVLRSSSSFSPPQCDLEDEVDTQLEVQTRRPEPGQVVAEGERPQGGNVGVMLSGPLQKVDQGSHTISENPSVRQSANSQDREDANAESSVRATGA